MHRILILLLSCCAICKAGLVEMKVGNGGNNNNNNNNLRNMTEVTSSKPKEDTSLPKQIRKFLRECGAEISDEVKEEEEGSEETPNNLENEDMKLGDVKKAHKNNKGTYPSSYGGGGGSDEDEDYDQPNHRKNNKNKYKSPQITDTFKTSGWHFDNYRNNRMNNRKGGSGDRNRGGNQEDEDYDESEEGCGNKNKKGNRNNKNNRNDNRRGGGGGGGGGGGNKNKGNNRYGNRGGDDYAVYDRWRRYNYGGRLLDVDTQSYYRRKREESEEETQCLPQCVLGHLNMLDDNRAPSETLVAKYFQKNTPDGSEKMKLLRNVRKCFAKLATLDSEEGCNFSIELAKCMKLDMEGKIK